MERRKGVITFYSQKIMDMVMEGCTMIPVQGCPTKYFEVNFKYWKNLTLSCTDPAINEALYFACETLKILVDKYKENHAFSDPMFMWKQDGEFSLKVGLMQMDFYKQLYEKKDENNSLDAAPKSTRVKT